MSLKQNVIKSLIVQTKEIQNQIQDQALQMIGDQSYGLLNFQIWSQKKTQITLLKEQQYIDPEQLEKLDENENQNNNWNLFRIFQVIAPEEPKKIFWDLVGMGFIFIQMILIPLILTFSLDLDDGFSIFDNIMDCYFIVDIVLQFQTGYYNKGNYISQRRMIALNYLKLWFWLDLISSFPYDAIISLTIEEDNQQEIQRNTQIIKIMRVLRFVKVIRLMRALKLKKIINQIEDSLSLDKSITSFIQFLKICLIILCLSHWLACIWNAIRLFQPNQQDWYSQYVVNYYQKLDNDPNYWFNQYVAGIYFSITTMITIGYGDISPKNTIERSFGVFVMILASGVFGYVMNSIVLLFQNTNESLEELLNQNDSVKKYLKQKCIHKSLQARIKNYSEWLIEDEQLQKGYANNTLEKLSLPLRNQVTQLVHGNMMSQIKFLRKNFSSLLLKKLAFIFQEEIYNPEDWIIKHDDPINDSTSIYFILNGRVSICLPKTKGIIDIHELTKKQYFGEISFFANVPRCASVKARNFINIFRLSRKHFIELCEREDLEQFFQLKFNIEFEQKLTDLNIQCFVCSGDNHTAKYCPNTHYVINKYDRINIIEKYNYQIKLMINSKRRLRKKTRTFTNFNKNQKAFQQITSDLYTLEKYLNSFKKNKLTTLRIKDSFKTDSIKEYTNFIPYSNLRSIARLQNYNAEIYAETVRQLKEQEKKNKLKSKFVKILQNKQEKRSSQQSQKESTNKFSKLILDLTKIKQQQKQDELSQTIEKIEQNHHQQKLSRLTSPKNNNLAFNRTTTINNNCYRNNRKLKRMRRNSFLNEQNEINQFQEIIDVIPEDALESPVQLLNPTKSNKLILKPLKLFKSTESTMMLSIQSPNLQIEKQKKRSQSIDQINTIDYGLQNYHKQFLENMIYLVLNYKLQDCK
ncbi:unnamed protein product [Paramecium sonneborni]|uniref:Cyclic nucleotide-binding domain-containing protein n=1 Tax=Paramecium sonneborni TaxID=65129 RepID=A0A8S1P0T2_9CILI|nr:unnamed protein product [Paramecium sonneborni]